MSQQDESQYGPRRASYDLKKRARTMAALIVLRDGAIKPLLAAAVHDRRTQRPHNPTPLDIHYQTIRESMRGVFNELGVAA